MYWSTVYTKGLGEFFYQNKIDFRGLVSFPFVTDTPERTASLVENTSNRYLVGFGGGKDSLLTTELLKKAHILFDPFVIETQTGYPTIDALLETHEMKPVRIRRIIDPQLLELNNRDDVFNGHIPISAVYAWVGILASVLYGYDGFIVSNERSANVGSTMLHGMEINHQWSKSFEFESMMRAYIKQYVSPSMQYISLLRPFSEYSIVKMFSAYPQYFSQFSSCNQNFRLKGKSASLWCGRCPKCAFVFALLAAVIPKQQMLSIFGSNLFELTTLEPLYRELLGLEGIKPFECVGTPEEVQLSFAKIHENGEYEDTLMMKLFVSEVLHKIDVDKLEAAVTTVDRSSLPAEFIDII